MEESPGYDFKKYFKRMADLIAFVEERNITNFRVKSED
jgi:hypothetical protein